MEKEKIKNIFRKDKHYRKSFSRLPISFWQGKLVLIGLLFSVFLVVISLNFSYQDDVNNNYSVAYLSKSFQKYKERLDTVYNEYKGEEKEVSKLIITSTFSILQSNVKDFSYDDMSLPMMRKVADLFLNEVKASDGSITFSSKTEDDAKEALAGYFKEIKFKLSDTKCKRMASDVYDHVASYKEFTKKEDTNKSMCLSTGNTQASIFLNMSTSDYIATMGPIAQADFSRNGVFASVTLAQSIIESGWGKSGLTQMANNMFGIKCSSNWTGECINMATGEYGSGGYYTINANFRKYPSIEDSVNDHSTFLKENPRYGNAGAFSASTYQEQITAIANAGYATSPTYASSIINTIQMYNLDAYDVPLNVSNNLCYTGSGNFSIRTVAPTANDIAFTRKNSNRGQCVWYAQARAYEVVLELASKGIITKEQETSISDKLFSIYGNGGEWVGASSSYFQTSTNIKDIEAGALISWTKPNGYGHIAFVEEVTSDSVTISEGWATATNSCPSNWNCVNFKLRTMSLDEFYNSFGPYYIGNYNFSGYIYPLRG